MIRRGSEEVLEHQVLRELYRVAIEEYRFTVSQNSERQKFFVGLNVAVSSVVPAVLSKAPTSFGMLPSLVLVIAAFTSALGIGVIEKSHEHYRSARRHFQNFEQLMGLDALGLSLGTTIGMRGRNSRFGWFKVYRSVQVLLALLFVFDVVAAWALWS